MSKRAEKKKFHQKAYHHVRKHRKKYSRFILFFVILSLFRIIEDYFLVKSISLEFEVDLFILFSIIFTAFIFTAVSELTEKMIEEEEARKLLEFIRKEKPKLESIIKGKKKIVKKKIKRKS